MYEIKPQHDFLVGIDSDGCAFDTMELKHKECFIPNTIKHYKLQAVSKYAREAAEFVNLYSKSRGVNRFPALIETLEWLQKRPEVLARKVKIEVPAAVAQWIREESKLSNPVLETLVQKTGDCQLRQALEWSQAVNDDVAEMVEGVPPFPYVRECLEKLAPRADMLVVSATPNAALMAEWQEHDIARFVAAICGQEIGSKKQVLGNAQKYGPGHTLMVGDAPGDFEGAKANDCLFFPINPGNEEASWQQLYEVGIDRFLGGSFAGAYQEQLLEEFDRVLPARPSWNVVS